MREIKNRQKENQNLQKEKLTEKEEKNKTERDRRKKKGGAIRTKRFREQNEQTRRVLEKHRDTERSERTKK